MCLSNMSVLIAAYVFDVTSLALYRLSNDGFFSDTFSVTENPALASESMPVVQSYWATSLSWSLIVQFFLELFCLRATSPIFRLLW